MKRWFCGLGIVAGLVALSYGAWKMSTPEVKPSGESVSLAQAPKGVPVLVHFWASWCGPCVEEIPQWVQAAASWGASPQLTWMAVSGDQTWEAAHTILPETKLPKGVISILDPELSLAERLGTYQLPETYLLDAQHRVLRKWVGSQPWANAGFLEEIRGLLRGHDER